MSNILYMAISIDGKISGNEDDTSWVGELEINRMDDLMKKCGVMVMGSNTYRSFGEDLPNEEALQVVFTQNNELLNLQIENVRFTSESPKLILEQLKLEGYEDVLIAGGAELNTSLIQEGLIDEIRLIVKPIVLGVGKSLFNDLDKIFKFQFINCEFLDEGLVELAYAKS